MARNRMQQQQPGGKGRPRRGSLPELAFLDCNSDKLLRPGGSESGGKSECFWRTVCCVLLSLVVSHTLNNIDPSEISVLYILLFCSANKLHLFMVTDSRTKK